MDKSFNDDELSDIMKEIEALEEDFTPSEETSPEPVMTESPKVETTIEEPVSKETVVSLDSKRTAPKASSENSTSMSFKVQGNLTLDLSFDIGGKVVSLAVTENGLSIEMEGGVKFTVPVGQDTAIKKAA
ncbi:MAG: hypothetical protein ACLGHN_08380 [Bacteriovoracia bacterium]